MTTQTVKIDTTPARTGKVSKMEATFNERAAFHVYYRYNGMEAFEVVFTGNLINPSADAAADFITGICKQINITAKVEILFVVPCAPVVGLA